MRRRIGRYLGRASKVMFVVAACCFFGITVWVSVIALIGWVITDKLHLKVVFYK
jgi:hypothetical protein